MVLQDVNRVALACNVWIPDQWANATFIKENCGELQPDRDIAGIGVMIGFVVTSIITFLLSIGKGVCLIMLREGDGALRRFVMPNGPDGPPRWRWMPRRAQAIFWNHIFGKLVLGLADQQMVTGFAVLVAALHIRPITSAYNFYVMAHVAAFALVTQSIALLVLFDFNHKSLTLYAFRVMVFTITLGLFYTCAFLSNDLTGKRGYQAACPATCKFETGQAKFVMVVLAGFPIYAFIVTDLVREILYRLNILETKPRQKPRGPSVFRTIEYFIWRHGFQTVRVLAWIYTIGDFSIALWTVWSSWYLHAYDNLEIQLGYDKVSWDFGQLVAIILVALPFLSIVGEWKEQLNLERKQAYPDGFMHRHHRHHREGKLPTDEVSRDTPKLVPYHINSKSLDSTTPPELSPSLTLPLQGIARPRSANLSVADGPLLQHQYQYHHERNVSTGKIPRKPVPFHFSYKLPDSATTSETIPSPPIPPRGAARMARRPG